MSNGFLQDGMDAAIAGLREQQTLIREAGERMAAVRGSATSTDRMVTATADSQGRLVDLKLSGTRYRKLAAADLTARIVETVRAAQEEAQREAANTFAGLMPAGLGMPTGDFEAGFDEMFDAAIRTASGPLFGEAAEKGDGDGGV